MKMKRFGMVATWLLAVFLYVTATGLGGNLYAADDLRRQAVSVLARLDVDVEDVKPVLLDILKDTGESVGLRFEVLDALRGAGPEALEKLADDQEVLEVLSAIVLDESIDVSHRILAFQVHPDPDEEMMKARPLPAFPGAEGAGKYSRGGRGGDVYVVENTKSEGPGSLRYGIESADGPRNIVFNTQGTIGGSLDFEGASRITIAGQTAPGDGITLRQRVRVTESEDIIIQHLRFSSSGDPLRTDRSSRVMLSHLSVRWGSRNNWVLRPNGPLTLQYSINAEPTNRQLGGWFGQMRGREGYFTHTVHKNLGIHQGGRINMFQSGAYEFMNNITFNATPRHAYRGPYYIMSRPWHGGQLVEANVIGNVMIDGTPHRHRGRRTRRPPDYTFGFGRNSRVFIDGNMRDRSPDSPFSPEPADGDIIDGAPPDYRWRGDEFELLDELSDLDLRTARGFALEEQRTSPVDARRAYIDVLSRSGASAFRDVHDHRYVRDVMNKNARRLPRRLSDIPGEPFPEPDPNSFEPWVSTAGDGIPDEWKRERGLDPETEYHQEYTDEGYTYLEKYLHSLAPHSFPPDSSETEEIQVGSSYGEGGAAEVILEDAVHYGLLRFDLSQVEPGMLNDASLKLHFGDIEEPSGFRVYGLDHDRAGQRWDSGTIGPQDAPAMLVEDGEVSLNRNDLILLGDIEPDGGSGGSEVTFDNPNLAVFLNLAVYAGDQPDSHLVTLLLKPSQPDETGLGIDWETEPRLILEAVPARDEEE